MHMFKTFALVVILAFVALGCDSPTPAAASSQLAPAQMIARPNPPAIGQCCDCTTGTCWDYPEAACVGDGVCWTPPGEVGCCSECCEFRERPSCAEYSGAWICSDGVVPSCTVDDPQQPECLPKSNGGWICCPE